MRIERIEVFGVAVPLVGEFSTAYKSESIQKSAVVRVTDGDGNVGLGNVGSGALTILAEAPGIVVEDDPKRLHYPYVTRVNGQDEVFVGRIRADLSVAHGLHLWIVGDNLRRGAALSAVQIAEHLCDSVKG